MESVPEAKWALTRDCSSVLCLLETWADIDPCLWPGAADRCRPGIINLS